MKYRVVQVDSSNVKLQWRMLGFWLDVTEPGEDPYRQPSAKLFSSPEQAIAHAKSLHEIPGAKNIIGEFEV